MLAAAAVAPCPPLLVPEVAAGAAAELDALRAACSNAIAVLAAARPDRLVVVGPAKQAGRGSHPQGAAGSFRGFGVDLEVRLGAAGTSLRPAGAREVASQVFDSSAADRAPDAPGGARRRPLPPSLAVAAWLLERSRWAAAPVEGLGVGEHLSPDRCAETGRRLVSGADRVALLVMGDGSACRSLKAPGYLDERAAGFDTETARALGAADTTALLNLDEEPAHQLKAVGRAPWQVLAGAGEGAGMSGELLYDDAPYGVGYIVAAWT
jgi:hypothetical protein